MHDWRKAIRAPISYSVPGSSSALLRQQTNFVTFVVISGAFVLLTLYTVVPQSRTTALSATLDEEHGHEHLKTDCSCESQSATPYNRTYPLTPIETLSDGRLKYRIAAVADLDKKSRIAKGDSWLSYILCGNLIFDPHSSTVEINWNQEEQQLSSDYAAGGRGMELSDLVVFNGKLYTCDDRTGIVYEILDSLLLPWVILRNGNGQNTPKGFKCEWMSVKHEHLYVGGLGKEWTTARGDVIINHDPQWVKRISSNGHVEHLDWRLQYSELRRAAGIDAPGYLIHESAVWSNHSGRWLFLPRRASKQPYDEVLDEQRGTNILLTANSDFSNVTKSLVGLVVKTHGFSSIKLLPLPAKVKMQPEGSEIAIALKSEENNDIVSTYVTVFRIPDGHILLPETQISSKHKYEGIEFV